MRRFVSPLLVHAWLRLRLHFFFSEMMERATWFGKECSMLTLSRDSGTAASPPCSSVPHSAYPSVSYSRFYYSSAVRGLRSSDWDLVPDGLMRSAMEAS
jgi:hypothetical protein